MRNEKKVSFYDFAGGVNLTKPENHLQQNEMVELVNLIPDYKGYALSARPFIGKSKRVKNNVVTGDPLQIEEIVVPGITEPLVFAVKRGLNELGVDCLFLSLSNAGGSEQYFELEYPDYVPEISLVLLDFDTVGVFCSLGSSYTYDIATDEFAELFDMTTGTPEPLMNLRNVVMYQGRLFGIDDNGQVRFSGITDEYAEGALTKHWYEIWGVRSYTDGTILGDGGGFFIEPIQQSTTAICPTPDGLVILKSNSVSIWQFPAGANPGDYDSGAEIMIISRSVGCIDPGSVVSINGSALFIGNYSGNKRSVYIVEGTEVKHIGNNIDSVFKKGLNYLACVYDDIVYWFESYGTIIAGMTILGAQFFTCKAEYFTDVRCISKSDNPLILATTPGYPYYSIYEFDGDVIDGPPMNCSITVPNSSLFIDADRTSEYKTRKLFVDFVYGERSTRVVSSFFIPNNTGLDVINTTVHRYGKARYEFDPAPDLSLSPRYADVGEYSFNDIINISVGDFLENRINNINIDAELIDYRYGDGSVFAGDYDLSPTYFDERPWFKGVYVNKRCRNINIKFDIETRGLFAINGFDIIFRESGSIV